MRLPSYGGSLFDPARFRFLTARTDRSTLAITVSDRVMLEVLRAVQMAHIKGEARRISFRDIDVEQIGYIYEGLLGYTCEEVDETSPSASGAPLGEEPEIPLDTPRRLRRPVRRRPQDRRRHPQLGQADDQPAASPPPEPR